MTSHKLVHYIIKYYWNGNLKVVKTRVIMIDANYV